MQTTTARFCIGQLVRHQLFDYRGVIVDVDATFQGTNEWYEKMALSRPPRDKPWYHILVHGAIHRAYVAEINLTEDSSNEPINHPEINAYFSEFKDGIYHAKQTKN